MSKFIIQVNSPAYGSSSSYNAYRFTETALKNGHVVDKVFFYQDGVLNTNHLNSPASDEFDLGKAWLSLSERYNVPLVNCVSAALRRGVLSQTDANENQLSHWNMEPPFMMGGLGELVVGIESADRLVSF
ncbi:sulfurtransferase complex subunit TusD [Shewanella sp. Choline-02u-19]|jgi:tRNA 2-thiouridine synthesizing protein D|uniref:sulfurtransferase complex subunit TusD n=1 Tax=unclassified Shewanella TaxID=196818 RepID=UPI000C328358|nr:MULTISPECIES: sulfurtransferase complex subunit TusD [unclassified Shewanella]PKG57381.1 sulfurtransferase complex subunit TusD [Shewanella sp. GutDb-MelDb]PKG73204.1 sulfurtransferase complex subunit TusD [Shewanella sp. GutCb]PKH57962.1 sulfurtransferase complex subunit TusD [Shewanella sp. Bg11-22]PKI27489.1 sulfurtransferase complex subunit TusD [Shewanella sp. Choline-02u-19]